MMTFNFKNEDITNLKGKDVVWSGCAGKGVHLDQWKEEFARVDAFGQTGETKWVDVYVYGEEVVHRIDEQTFNVDVTEIKELNDAEKQNIIKEKKDKAEKNFRDELSRLINDRYKILSRVEKEIVINSLIY